jgi:hypothetical protein
VDDRTRDGGRGRRVSPTEDELRADEDHWVAFLHRDAAGVLLTLTESTGQVGDLVEAFGRRDCEPARKALRRVTRDSIRLLEPQFADLEGRNTMNTFLKILAAAGVVGSALVSAGIIPATLGIVFTAVGGVAAALHPSPAAVKAFGENAK